jgi:hypothetical protein
MLTQRQMADSPSLPDDTGDQSSPSQVLRLATSFWVSQTLYVVAKAELQTSWRMAQSLWRRLPGRESASSSAPSGFAFAR